MQILISYKALKHLVINFSAGRGFYSKGKNSYHHRGKGERAGNQGNSEKVGTREAACHTLVPIHMELIQKGRWQDVTNIRQAAATGTGSSRQKGGEPAS